MNAADELVRPRRIARCVSTAKRWRWATPESTPASCATAKRRPSAGLSAVDILVELGKRRMVGGEDMIVDVALDLLNRNK